MKITTSSQEVTVQWTSSSTFMSVGVFAFTQCLLQSDCVSLQVLFGVPRALVMRGRGLSASPLGASVRLSIWLIFQQFSFCVNRTIWYHAWLNCSGTFPLWSTVCFLWRGEEKTQIRIRSLELLGIVAWLCELISWRVFSLEGKSLWAPCSTPTGVALTVLDKPLVLSWFLSKCFVCHGVFIVCVRLVVLDVQPSWYWSGGVTHLQWKYTSICSLFCRPNT